MEDGKVNREKKAKLETGANVFVSITMIISGLIMFLVAILSPNEDKGNVIPGLSIAILGVIANCIFGARYTKLSKQTDNSILFIQSKLYRTKTFVDMSVTITLVCILHFPGSSISFYFDIIGTIVVSLYLIYTGIQTLSNNQSNLETK